MSTFKPNSAMWLYKYSKLLLAMLGFTMILLISVIANADGQLITTLAGNGTTTGISGDGGPATNASINGANGGVFDKYGNYYVAEILGHRIRKVSPDGIITTVAGTGLAGYSGDGLPATAAQLDNPTAVVIDALGNIIIDDGNNFRIRRVDGVTGIISTIAGTGTSGYNGDNIPATDAQIGAVQDICLDKSGNLYLADQGNLRVRKIISGVITTVAGDGSFSSSGPTTAGPATSTGFNFLSSVFVDKSGNIFVGDRSACRVWQVNTSGMISVIAGNGGFTYGGDGIPATAAQINPMRLTLNLSNELVIADKYNLRIFKIDEAGIIHTIAGNGTSGYSGDGGPATAASLDFPAGVVYDTCGNLYIAESTNRRVRKVSFNPDCLPISVKEMQGNEAPHITLHPNPATETLTITAGLEIETVAILNAVGQTVVRRVGSGEQQFPLDVSELPPGVYMVRVNEVYTGKMVKQ